MGKDVMSSHPFTVRYETGAWTLGWADYLAAFLKSPIVTNRADDDLTLLLATPAG